MKFRLITLTSILPFILFSAANAQNFAAVELTHLEPTKDQAHWVRSKQVTPLYPRELAMQGIVGCGVFKVNVDENGKTNDIELVSSVPADVIQKPATSVIRGWEWQNVSDKISTAEEKLMRLDFCMGGASQEDAQARCKEQAKMQCSA
ncbi:energy transducer TonB [Aliidiomarina sp. Khilg15.8]